MPIPLFNPIDVVTRLAELGWTRPELIEVAEAMLAGRYSCTENDPPGAGGWMSWKEGTRRMREIGALKEFVRNEDDHISSTFDAVRRNKFAVCNTDDGTGIPDSQPQNRSKKGAATDRAVLTNHQGTFGGLLGQSLNVFQPPQGPGAVTYWYLCVFADGEILRVELSCPSVCENGYFQDFRERIILIGPDEDDGGVHVRRDTPDGDSGAEISIIRRRQA